MGVTATERPAVSLLFNREQIAARVADLGAELTSDYRGRRPVLVGVLQGAVLFYADLIRQVRTPIRCDFVSVSSYREGTTSAGDPRLLVPPQLDWEGRELIFIDTIIDTGKTADLLERMARERKAASWRFCVLLDKPSRRTVEVRLHYTGFTIGNDFVVGYGLDYAGSGRNLPEIKRLAARDGSMKPGREPWGEEQEL